MSDGQSTKAGGEFPVLSAPPIVEVICGFTFEPLDLDVLKLGAYWDERSEQYPRTKIEPALMDGSGITLGPSPRLRAMLVSKDNVRVLQLQHDRFFMNWRKEHEEYPRFSTHGGEPGLLDQALREFELFSEFCERRIGTRPRTVRVELTKLDVLERPKHWTTAADLAVLLPITAAIRNPDHVGNSEFSSHFIEHRTPDALIIAISTILDRPAGETSGVQIETRALCTLSDGEEPRHGFERANTWVNQAFFRLLGSTATDRFQRVNES
jgi:uncharacterized protein (TIGR04255 family)